MEKKNTVQQRRRGVGVWVLVHVSGSDRPPPRPKTRPRPGRRSGPAERVDGSTSTSSRCLIHPSKHTQPTWRPMAARWRLRELCGGGVGVRVPQSVRCAESKVHALWEQKPREKSEIVMRILHVLFSLVPKPTVLLASYAKTSSEEAVEKRPICKNPSRPATCALGQATCASGCGTWCGSACASSRPEASAPKSGGSVEPKKRMNTIGQLGCEGDTHDLALKSDLWATWAAAGSATVRSDGEKTLLFGCKSSRICRFFSRSHITA